MAQWIALAITITGWIIAAAALWGRMTQRQEALEGRVNNLEDDSQTPGEREALQEAIAIQFKAHEELDNTRFAILQDAIQRKLDAILAAVGNNHGR